DEAIAARIVEEVPGSFGRLRFGHALVRDTLYEGIPATHRARLHRRGAGGVGGLYSRDPDPHPAQRAHHFALAGPPPPPPQLGPARRRSRRRGVPATARSRRWRTRKLGDSTSWR